MKSAGQIGIMAIVGFWVSISTAFSATAQNADWEKIGNPKEIEIFKKEIPESPVVAFKGMGVVKAPIAKLVNILLDTSRAKEWVDRLEEIKLLRSHSEMEYTTYTHIGTPPLMTDRDFVILNKLKVDPEKNVFVLSLSSTVDPDAPQTDYVRGEILNSSFTLKPISDSQTLVTAEIHTDPKGSVPKWAVNMFQKEWPYNTIQSLREQAQKTDIKEIPKVQTALSVLTLYRVTELAGNE